MPAKGEGTREHRGPEVQGHHLVRAERFPNKLPPAMCVPGLHSLANFNLYYLASRRGRVGASDQRCRRAGTSTGETIGLSQLPKRHGGLRVTAGGNIGLDLLSVGAGAEGCNESSSYWATRFGNSTIIHTCIWVPFLAEFESNIFQNCFSSFSIWPFSWEN